MRNLSSHSDKITDLVADIKTKINISTDILQDILSNTTGIFLKQDDILKTITIYGYREEDDSIPTEVFSVTYFGFSLNEAMELTEETLNDCDCFVTTEYELIKRMSEANYR